MRRLEGGPRRCGAKFPTEEGFEMARAPSRSSFAEGDTNCCSSPHDNVVARSVYWELIVIVGLLVGWLFPRRLVPPQLAALRRDPRLVASAAAILWLLVDDHPAQPYATFGDPGAAVMLSIVFGNSLALV